MIPLFLMFAMALTLADYPDAIANAEVATLAAQAAALVLAETVEGRRAQFAAMVATDPALKNEAQRKAGIAELQGSDPEFVGLAQKQRSAAETLELTRIEVRRLERLFQVALILAKG